ncbi:MAG: ThuA domain-containing protein [Parvibaculum sp.]|nr:ThuA domain-containing protein [Parvibaculum sp.]
MRKALYTIAGIAIAGALTLGGYIGYDLWSHEMFKTASYDETPPELPQMQGGVKVLLFSKTNSYRHDSIPDAIAMFQGLAVKDGWSLFTTENGAVHNAAQLAQFDVVIWNNVTGDVLTEPQREALQAYIEGGGRFLGVHGTIGNESYAWSWMPKELIRAQFIGHTMIPQTREGTLIIEDVHHPVVEGLLNPWRWIEEWYSFSENPRDEGVSVLVRVDEDSYKPGGKLPMGKDHPLVWCHHVGKGLVLMSALGHRKEAYADPHHRMLLEHAVIWLASDAAPAGEAAGEGAP